MGRTETEVTRIRNLRQYYGITLEKYEAMLAAQGGVCAICGSPPRGGKTCSKNLNVDHDHVTGKIRGLLCNDCNSSLGKFKDSIETLEKAISYLRLHNG